MAYTMAKASLNHMNFNLAKEMSPYRVNVNLIQPGYGSICTSAQPAVSFLDQCVELLAVPGNLHPSSQTHTHSHTITHNPPPTHTRIHSYCDTPGERNNATEEDLLEAGRGIAWGRLGQPSDIGNAAVRA